jgi:hypothetical protein
VSWLRLDLESATVAAALLLVAALVLRRTDRRWSAWIGAASLETALVCGLFALWQLANRMTHTHAAGGQSNGRAVWDLERTLHLPSETTMQSLILGHPSWVRASNYYYATAHLTGMLVFLVWMWLRHREHYPRWRNVLVITTGVCLLIEMVPVAPPRLIGGTGLVDTAMVYGQSVYEFVGSNLADQYAAMPSVHVAWAVLIAIACLMSSTSRWRWIGVVHGGLTCFVVVATANHYWLDGVAAVAILGAAILVQGRLSAAIGRARGSTTKPAPTSAPPAVVTVDG